MLAGCARSKNGAQLVLCQADSFVCGQCMSDVLQILAAAISQAKSSPDSRMLSMLRERCMSATGV